MRRSKHHPTSARHHPSMAYGCPGCVYVYERRKEREKAKEREAELCKMKNIGRVQEFFLQEVQLGEHWLSRGEHKKSVEHLTNAISVCAQPHQLLQVLHHALPPQVFEMLMQRIPYTKQRLQAALNEQDCAEEEKE
ncbi:TOMM20-like protein 1 isoform X3 [Carettochelys insculpta]|uniref:TOMM20-like protein 1 isoform X3 n=1 Tax=Carettochelys insculpta TaxID=44489 RepID=UPI003EBA6399